MTYFPSFPGRNALGVIVLNIELLGFSDFISLALFGQKVVLELNAHTKLLGFPSPPPLAAHAQPPSIDYSSFPIPPHFSFAPLRKLWTR